MDFIRKIKDKFGNKLSIPCDPSDSKPVEISPNLKRMETQDERVRRIIREQIRPQNYGYETEDDNEDLEVEDDPEFLGELPLTPSEFNYIESTHGDLIEETLTPHSSPEQEAEGQGDPPENPPEPSNNEEDINEGRNTKAAS